ncbi:4973_t:CDS:2 [Paraglomus brasilianum]|uniref:4973_t:CDS:1 n=1 Tax=Paraglomus brasilianum TaxID=144538 RepID=A0A9N9BY86_9GLOM|nr:4973_t:CDS:2 [Paraglomus brasilianum]
MTSRTSRTSRRQSKETNSPDDTTAGASDGVDIPRPWSLPPVIIYYPEFDHQSLWWIYLPISSLGKDYDFPNYPKHQLIALYFAEFFMRMPVILYYLLKNPRESFLYTAFQNPKSVAFRIVAFLISPPSE